MKNIKLPMYKRILYKKNTKNLRISYEKLTTYKSLDESTTKDSENKKKVKFAMKNLESPKNYEPDFTSTPKKSILKQKEPIIVDWNTLQEKLDCIFNESESKLKCIDS